ncbi:MAG: nucleotidyl transferase AbiEii/AbiGii toxin family protein [Elusimicrobia bacterium]|nr:nucleotidyl transferase AbiEii/AbiGii toxin family protein [Elusimicrobiota bacterium]
MFQQLLIKLGKELNKNKIPYMVIGGQAVLVYGEPRLTKDIDITLGIGSEEIAKIKTVIKKIGLRVLVKDLETFVHKTMVCPVVDKKSGIRINFIFSFTLYEQPAISRAKKVKIGKTDIPFASLEDLIIHKLIAKRERDIEDVKTILLKNPNYDKKYILKWLRDFDETLGTNLAKVFAKVTKDLK